MAGFVTINVFLGVVVYALFSKAGIIGGDRTGGGPPKRAVVRGPTHQTRKPTGILDAELAD